MIISYVMETLKYFPCSRSACHRSLWWMQCKLALSRVTTRWCYSHSFTTYTPFLIHTHCTCIDSVVWLRIMTQNAFFVICKNRGKTLYEITVVKIKMFPPVICCVCQRWKDLINWPVESDHVTEWRRRWKHSLVHHIHTPPGAHFTING